jgi:hypothetical protein
VVTYHVHLHGFCIISWFNSYFWAGFRLITDPSFGGGLEAFTQGSTSIFVLLGHRGFRLHGKGMSHLYLKCVFVHILVML